MSKAKRIGLIVFIFVVIISAVSAYFIVQIQDDLNYLAQMPLEDVDLSTVEDGKYLGEYDSFPVSVILEVVVEDHEIISIDILKHNNGQGAAAEAILFTVMTEQSIEVDAIAGATYSSKVILLAIKDALE
ncbi:MAG: FMN-binding protein [Tenericutes bacterium]|nr:FMN-binding protein [Mycoplasmatota bacterium]